MVHHQWHWGDSFEAMGVTDLSLGSNLVFKIPESYTFGLIDQAVKRSPQFRRLGPGVAQLLNVPAEPVLVKCILNGPPQLFTGFTSPG
jgi:hypothetical protein